MSVMEGRVMVEVSPLNFIILAKLKEEYRRGSEVQEMLAQLQVSLMLTPNLSWKVGAVASAARRQFPVLIYEKVEELLRLSESPS